MDYKSTGETLGSANTHKGREFGDLILAVVRRRRVFLGVIIGSIAAAALTALITPTVYRSQIVLVRADTGENSTIMQSALSQLGGIAALAGVDLNRNATVVEAIALLKSREFTQDFIRDRKLLPKLFHRRWDAVAGKWKDGVRQPNLWDGYKLFDRKIRHIDEDKKTGIVSLEIDWEDPSEGADWANDLIRRLNAQMKARALEEARTTVAYLTKEAQATGVASVQVAIENLIEANMKQQAVASVRPEYVFRVVDPAVPADPRERLSPRWGIYLVTGGFFGVLLGILLILGYDAIVNVRDWICDADTTA